MYGGARDLAEPSPHLQEDEPALDVAMLVPLWSKLADWKGLHHLYVAQRPKVAAAGSRVWLCRDRRLFYSYRIDGFVELAGNVPQGSAGEEPGWAFEVSDGKGANRPLDKIEDASGVATRWQQGFRYMTPGAHAFVRAPRVRARRAPRLAAVPEGAPPEPAPPVAAAPARQGWWRTRFGRRRDHDTK
jgi:hypothetical protein